MNYPNYPGGDGQQGGPYGPNQQPGQQAGQPGQYDQTQMGMPIPGYQPPQTPGSGYPSTPGGYPGATSQPQGAYPVAGPPGQPPTGPQGWGPAGPQPPRKNNNKKILIGVIAAAVVVVVAIAVTLIVVFTGGDDETSSPDAAVKTYLEALAAGDAKKALSVSKTPPDDKLLTDAILKKQQSLAKISDINVRKPDNDYAYSVKATYKFGDRNADVDVRVQKSGGQWQVVNGALEVNVDNLQLPQPTLFGVDISQDNKVYVFPGPLEWGSNNKYLAAKTNQKDFTLGPDSTAYVSTSNIDVGLSSAGQTAVQTAIDTYLTDCATSKQGIASTDKPGCGQAIFGARSGTVTWTKPTDLSGLEYSVNTYTDPGTVRVSGQVTWSATYVPSYGDDNRDTDNEYLSGKVDLTQSTPTFSSS